MASLETNINQVSADFKGVKDAIMAVGVEVTDGTKTSDYADKVAEVYAAGEEAGKQAQYDEFWDIYQENGERGSYEYSFAGRGWTDETYNPKYPMKVSVCTNMYRMTKITDVKTSLDISGATGAYVFAYASDLVNIPLLVVSETNVFTQDFYCCDSLQNITIEGVIAKDIDFQHSALLSKESITSIVNALSDTVTGQTITFSKTALYNAFGITISADEDIPEDNDFYAIRWSKPNWTFGYAE